MSNGKSRALIVTLVVSLAINLLFIGALVGRIIMGPPPAPQAMHMGWIVRSLDEETRRELAPEFRSHMREMIPRRREMREAQEAFRSALTDPELSEVELTNVLARLRDSSEDFQRAMHEQMVTVISKLSPEERTRLARFLSERSRHERGRHGEREHRPHPAEP